MKDGEDIFISQKCQEVSTTIMIKGTCTYVCNASLDSRTYVATMHFFAAAPLSFAVRCSTSIFEADLQRQRRGKK